LAIVVGDPRIASSIAGSIGEMMLLNLFCKLVGLGGSASVSVSASEGGWYEGKGQM
jgi:hypothetical protein